jgi:hypothetical protein
LKKQLSKVKEEGKQIKKQKLREEDEKMLLEETVE